MPASSRDDLGYAGGLFLIVDFPNERRGGSVLLCSPFCYRPVMARAASVDAPCSALLFSLFRARHCFHKWL
jgi:hypothetical protein